MLLPPLLPKVARLQEDIVSILGRTVIIQCVPTHWNRKKCIEKWHKPVSGKGTMHETSLFFTRFFEDRTLSSNPSFSAHEKQSDGCFFRSRESGFEAALGSRNFSTSYPFLPQNPAFPSCILTSIRYNLVELVFEIMF